MGGWRFCAFKGKVSWATTILFVRMLTFRKITGGLLIMKSTYGVIEKLKLLTDAEFAELEFPPD